MSTKINIIKFIETQTKERYKSCVLYGPALSRKTALAKALAHKLDGQYIDLLEDFAKQDSLKKQIDTFEPSELKTYLRQKSCGNCKIMIIDNMDFLINIWDESQKDHFLNFIENDEYQTLYCFVMQEHKFMNNRCFYNNMGQERLINIYNIE